MPKVVAYDNRILTNANRNDASGANSRFGTFCCRKCLRLCLITDQPLSKDTPRRRTDDAPVFDASKYIVKLHTTAVPDPIRVRRTAGIERQYLHNCSECGQLVAYQCVAHGQELKYLYLVDSAVVWPRQRAGNPELRCSVCGYFARDAEAFEVHKKQRGHQKQEGGQFGPDAEGGAQGGEGADGQPRRNDDAPMPPVIVG
eukprot:GHVT01074243.1.p1 GENE.GHVT01074243.1~~GHVT01074243.1.p1  ORF type:complete len:200 (-),score=27.74 GHVT01074243.1:340-939(-)